MATQDPEKLEIRAQTTRTLDDLLFLSRHAFGNLLGMRIMRWISYAMVLGAVATALMPLGEDAGLEARLVLVLGILPIPALVLVVMPLLISYSIRNQWRASAEIREPVTYIFSASGIQATGQTYEGKTSGHAIATTERVGSIILLRTTQKVVFYMLRVNDFESDADYEAFRKLVANKVANCSL